MHIAESKSPSWELVGGASAIAIAAVAVVLLLLRLALPEAPVLEARGIASARRVQVSPMAIGVGGLPQVDFSSPAENPQRAVDSPSALVVAIAQPTTGSSVRPAPPPFPGSPSVIPPSYANQTTGSSVSSPQTVRPPRTEVAVAAAVLPEVVPVPVPVVERATPEPVRVVPPPAEPPIIQGEDRGPVPLGKIVLAYPPLARSQRLEGWVKVRITVGADGHVEKAVIEESSSPIFDKSALEAAQRMRFNPGLAKGRPARLDYLQKFDFVLN